MFFLVSCSLFKKSDHYQNIVPQLTIEDKDYRDHLESLGRAFENNAEIKSIKLSKRSQKYLQGIQTRIIKNNELLILEKQPLRLTVIKNKAPIIFSLPGQQIYISSGLISKYFNNESLFVAALAFEMVKSGRNVYKKGLVIPTGLISIYKILSLVNIPLAYKRELNKLTYFSLKRAGFEYSALLNWIQLQNKNAIDFSMMNRNRRVIVEEELYFKRFLSTQELEEQQNQVVSTKDFYYLVNEIKRKNR